MASSNSPTGLNFAIAGYAHAKGTVLTDPSLPLENVSNESHVAVFAFATTLNVFGKSAKVDLIVPYASLAAKGDVRLLSIERRQFEAVLRERPETALALMRILCERLATLERGGAVPA